VEACILKTPRKSGVRDFTGTCTAQTAFSLRGKNIPRRRQEVSLRASCLPAQGVFGKSLNRRHNMMFASLNSSMFCQNSLQNTLPTGN
jgi:hypothetical protein